MVVGGDPNGLHQTGAERRELPRQGHHIEGHEGILDGTSTPLIGV